MRVEKKKSKEHVRTRPQQREKGKGLNRMMNEVKNSDVREIEEEKKYRQIKGE